MKTLTKFILLGFISSVALAQNDLSHFKPSYTVQEHKVSYDSQLSKEEVLPAIGVSVHSEYLKNFSFTLAYANEIFKDIRMSNTNKDIENIYFQVQYRF
jgi:hypothetical protein